MYAKGHKSRQPGQARSSQDKEAPEPWEKQTSTSPGIAAIGIAKKQKRNEMDEEHARENKVDVS